jgi:tetratricopeptide (TPR) repeat protein
MRKFSLALFLLLLIQYRSIANNICNGGTDTVQFRYALIEGSKFLNLGKLNDALSFFKIALRLNPKSGASNYQIASIYQRSGDNFKALDYCRRAVRCDLRNETYLQLLASLYVTDEKIDSSILVYEALVRYNPNNYDNKVQLLSLYIEGHNYKKAKKLLKNLEFTYGFTPEIFITKYQLSFLQADYKKCYNIIRQGILNYPNEVKFYQLLASHFELLGKKDSAIFYYNKVLLIDPDYEEVYSNILDLYEDQNDFPSFFVLLSKYMQNPLFEYSKKITIIQTLLQDRNTFESHSKSIRSLIDILLNLYSNDVKTLALSVEYNFKVIDFKAAKNDLLKIVKIDSFFYEGWEHLLFVYNSLGDYDSVINYSNQSIKIFQNKPLLYLYRGIAYFQKQDYLLSLSSLNKGLTLDTFSVSIKNQFYIFLAEGYQNIQQYDSSDYYFRQSILLDSTNLLVLNNYSYYLSLRNQNLKDALRFSSYCIVADPKNYTYLDTYGWILFKLNLFDKSKFYLESAIQNGGYNNSEILEHYAELLYVIGNKTESYKYYQMILDMGKSSNRLKSLLNP